MARPDTVMVHVHAQPFAFGSGAPETGVMVEIRGPDRRLTDRQILNVNAKSPTPMRIGTDTGPHEARAILASGAVLHVDLEHNGATVAPAIHFDLTNQSPHESLQRTATVYRLPTTDVGNYNSARYLSAWVQLWQRTSSGWAQAMPELDLRYCSWDHDAVRLTFSLLPRRYVLQVGGPRIPPVLTALPSGGACEVAILPTPGSDHHPIELSVTPQSAEAAMLLGFLATGSVAAVESILTSNDLVRSLIDGDDAYERQLNHTPSVLDLAEQVLYRKLNDPNTAALGGYYLLRTGELARLHSWPRNLADWIGWLPDGAVIRGWQLLRGASSSRGETPRQRFLQAAQRGVPCYAEGLRLLVDGLKVVLRDNEGDQQVASALEVMGRYASAADWTRSVLTFSGDGPDTPTPSPRPESRAGEPGTLMLHSITIDDLVQRRLLLPGAVLRTDPRPARHVAAAFRDEIIVTAEGLLDWAEDHGCLPTQPRHWPEHRSTCPTDGMDGEHRAEKPLARSDARPSCKRPRSMWMS